jgi:hypothetical protein
VAGRFPLYTDADVRGSVVKALIAAGWDVVRAIDLYPEKTDDHVHFERAVRDGRVLVANDRDMKAIAEKSLKDGRAFPGMVWWERKKYARMTEGDIVRFFEALAAQDDAFAYPIVFLKPNR